MVNHDYFKAIEDFQPEENGVYQWRSFFGKVKVKYVDGVWFLKSNGDRLPAHVVKFWR